MDWGYSGSALLATTARSPPSWRRICWKIPRFASAVVRAPGGYFMVDDSRLGFAPQNLDGMREAGAAAIAAALAAA